MNVFKRKKSKCITNEKAIKHEKRLKSIKQETIGSEKKFTKYCIGKSIQLE